MTDLPAEIKKILDKHESRFRLEPLSFPNEKLDNDRLERIREFQLMTTYLNASVDEDDVEELKQNIADKLALNSLQKISRNDWWWSPSSDLVASTLRDVQRTLEKATNKGTGDRLRRLRWLWWVFRELIYLAIVVGMFSVASSTFETVVVAALVLIYSRIALVGTALFVTFLHLAYTAELIYWEFGRTLRLKVPISRLTEAKKLAREVSIPSLIHNISIAIGTLIAIWHLVMALWG